MACSRVLSPITIKPARPSSIRSPSSLMSARDMPRHRWPLTPPTPAPTIAVPMIAGENRRPTTAPAAAPPQAPAVRSSGCWRGRQTHTARKLERLSVPNVEGSVEGDGRVNEGEMSEGLGEIADLAATRVDLF